MPVPISQGITRRTFYAGTRRFRHPTALSDRQTKQVQKIVNLKVRRIGEPHHFDSSATITALTTSTTPTLLSGVGQGDTDITRTGDRITPYSLSFKYLWNGNSGGTVANMRVIVFQWFPDDASEAPSATKLLESSSPSSFYNWDDRRKFKVLWDRRYYVSNDVDSRSYMGKGEIYIPGKKLKKIQYDNTATNGINNLYIMAFSDVAANGPSFNFAYRLTFKD